MLIVFGRKHCLASVAREIEFSTLMLSVSKAGYDERTSWALEGIDALVEDSAWAGGNSGLDEDPEPTTRRFEEAREITAIISRV